MYSLMHYHNDTLKTEITFSPIRVVVVMPMLKEICRFVTSLLLERI